MLELTVFLVAGLVLAALFLLWAWSQWTSRLEVPSADVGRLLEVVSLPAVSYQQANRLFDARDYLYLARQPQLQQVARQFEQDRRQAALLWLRLLREDFEKLRRLHRILTAWEVRGNARTEWAILVSLVYFPFLHAILTTWIRLFGLYAAPRAHLALLVPVRQVSALLSNLLVRLSLEQLAEVRQLWSAHELSSSPLH